MKQKRSRNFAALVSVLILVSGLLSFWWKIAYLPMIGSAVFLAVHICKLSRAYSSYEENSVQEKNLRYILFFSLFFFICCIAYVFIAQQRSSPSQKEAGEILLLLIFIGVLGNLAPRIPYNRYVGLRLPWTIAHERTWRFAHRILGYCTIPAMLLLLMALVFRLQEFVLFGLLSFIGIPSILSLHYDKVRQQDQNH